MSSPRSEFIAGVKALAPLLLSVIPSSLITSAAAIGAGLPISIAWPMSFIIFAGPAQLIIAQLVTADMPAWVIVLMGAIINIRLMLYSLSMSPYLKHLSSQWKAVLAYLLTDPAYAVSIVRFTQGEASPHRHWFLFGAGLALWATWQLGTSAGILLGLQLPANIPLDFTIPLTFIALVMAGIKDRATATAVVVSGIVVMLTLALPLRLNLVAATLMGILMGLWMETR
jgi:4-azaleucine resistance transporter AzlC